MRIISQDGRTDLPYDGIALFVNDNVIMAESLNRERIYVIAEYDSEETAMSVLNELREDVSLVIALKESLGEIRGDLYYAFPKEKTV